MTTTTDPLDDVTHVKNLKKRVDYYLTFDYWPHGGTKVRLKTMVPAKLHFPGTRGMAAEMVDENGATYLIMPKGFLFNQPVKPREQTAVRSPKP